MKAKLRKSHKSSKSIKLSSHTHNHTHNQEQKPKFSKSYKFTRPKFKNGNIADYYRYLRIIADGGRFSWEDAGNKDKHMTFQALAENGLICYNKQDHMFMITELGTSYVAYAESTPIPNKEVLTAILGR